MKLTVLLALFLVIFCSVAGAAWPVVKLQISARNEFDGADLADVTLEILKDGKKFLTKTSLSDGRFPELELPVQHVYTLRFKKEGYVTKVAEVNACFDYLDGLGPIVYGLMEVSLFIPVPGVDYAFLETTPMAKFYIDYLSKELVYNKEYTKAMLAEIAKRTNEDGNLKRDRQIEQVRNEVLTEKQVTLIEPRFSPDNYRE